MVRTFMLGVKHEKYGSTRVTALIYPFTLGAYPLRYQIEVLPTGALQHRLLLDMALISASQCRGYDRLCSMEAQFNS